MRGIEPGQSVAGAEPQPPLVVLQDAEDCVTGQAILVIVMRHLSGVGVQARQAAAPGAHPERARTVEKNRSHRVGREALGVARLALKASEGPRGRVKAVEPARGGADPEVAVAIFD